MKELLSILKNAAIERVKVNQAAGTGDVTSDSVDMQGYEGVIFLTALGTITSTGVPSMKAQQSSDDGSTDTFADLEGTGCTGDSWPMFGPVWPPSKTPKTSFRMSSCVSTRTWAV